MNDNVVYLFPEDIRENPVKMLRAIADDIENGQTLDVDFGCIVLLRQDGSVSVYDFGPEADGPLKSVGLLTLASTLVQETTV